MLTRLIGLLRSKPNYRPEVTIFVRGWRHDAWAMAHRTQRPASPFYHRRRLPRREPRKPKGAL